MSFSPSDRLTTTTLLSATLLSLCGLGQAASAPVLSAGLFPMTAIDEDISLDLDTGDNFNDQLANIYVDSGFRGVAIISMDRSHGRWQYTSFQQGLATQWFDIPVNISSTNALLLAVGTGQYSAVRFIPDANFNSAVLFPPSITVRAWNGEDTAFTSTQDASQVFGDASVNGGTTSYSARASVGKVVVNAVNDAPVLSITGVSDLGSSNGFRGLTSAIRIDSFLAADANGGGGPIADVDDNALQGIAIVGADSSNGTWEFTADGSQFLPFPGDLDDSHALLLASVVDAYTSATTMAVRFSPNPGFRGSATFTYRAWDQSQPDFFAMSGSVDVDVSANGGSSQYSADVRTARIGIVNSAPSMGTTATALSAVAEDVDPAAESGTTLSPLFQSPTGSFIDADGNPEGVAIVAADGSNGTWQYTSDNSLGVDTTWTDVGAVSGSSALLLHVTSANYQNTNVAIRFVPSPDFNTDNGTVPSITLRAWDETQGQSSADSEPSYFDVDSDLGANGATSAFGSGTVVLTQLVAAVNDAPVLVSSGLSHVGSFPADAGPTDALAVSLLVDATHNSGEAVISDVDAPADPHEGIAIIAADASNGTWEYSVDLGDTFSPFPLVAPDQALLLAAGQDAILSGLTDTFVRFTPNEGFHGTATFQYRAWDQSDSDVQFIHSGTDTQDTTTNGGTTAYSVDVRTASVTIGVSNAAPVLAASGTGNLGTVTNAVDGQVATFTVDDVISAADNGGTAPLTDSDGDTLGIAVTAADSTHGTWEYFAGEGGFAPFPAVTSSAALILGSGTQVRFVPFGDFAGTAAITYRGWDGTDGSGTGEVIDPGVGGGTSAYSAASRSAAFTVTSSPFTEITDTSFSGLQGVVANLLGPNSQISVDPESISYVGISTIGGAQASTLSAIDLGTAADGTRMTIPGSGLLLTTGDGTPRLVNTDAADLAAGQSASVDLFQLGDNALDTLTDETTSDACSLSFTFTVPAGINSVRFQMMYGTEEFGSLLGSGDAAAVFVDGINVAIFDNNPSEYLRLTSDSESLFEANTTAHPLGTEYNGVTRPATVIGALSAQATVHTITIVIADVQSQDVDSGLFISSLVGSTASVGTGIVVTPPGGNVAQVTVPPIGISHGTVVTYASLCPSTPEGIANLTSHLAGRSGSQVRGFTWDSTTQAYVELPAVPTGGLTPSTGVFLATRIDLGLDFTGTPQTAPFAITLHPGWNFVGVPPLASSAGITVAHQFPDEFVLSQEGIDVTDPAAIANLIGTPGGDISTAVPFFWNGTAYIQDGVLTTGEGYWIKNNQDSGDLVLTCEAPLQLGGLGGLGGQPGRFNSATASLGNTRALASPVHDRGIPPPPPGGSTAGSGSASGNRAEGGKSCGLGSGVAAFASMLMLALRRRLRGGRRD